MYVFRISADTDIYVYEQDKHCVKAELWRKKRR